MGRLKTIDPDVRPATVSICVAEDERERMRRCAESADMTLSAWAHNRILRALATQEGRKAAKDMAAALKAQGKPRTSRMSTIMPLPEHDALRRQAKAHDVSVHAFVQAAVVGAMRAEIKGAAPVSAKGMAEAAREVRERQTFTLRVPVDVANVDNEALSTLVLSTCLAMGRAVFEGQGPRIRKQIETRLAKVAAAGGEDAPVRLAVPRMEFEVVGRMLDLPAEEVALALATRAAQAL